jgi:hypothetical protein
MLSISSQETERRIEFTGWVSRSLAWFRLLDAFELHFRGSLSSAPDEDTLLRQFVLDASEHTFDLRDFVMTFTRTSSSPHTQVAWRRVGEDWRREY